MNKKKALLVELNPYHGEIIPGYSWLLSQLGYSVTVLLRDEVMIEEPFYDVKQEELPVLISASLDSMLEYISNIKAEDYDIICFSSNVLWDPKHFVGDIFQILDSIPRAKIGSLFVEHNMSYLDTDNSRLMFNHGRIMTLLPYKIGNKITTMVNPHYYGQKDSTHKRKKEIEIIAIGVSNKEPETLNTIFQAVRENVQEKFTLTLINAESIIIPDDLKLKVDVTKRLSFPEYSRIVAKADYVLTVFSGTKESGDKYLSGTTSGTIQVTLSSHRPMIMDVTHASHYGFNVNEYISFQNTDLSEGIRKAINQSDDEYDNMAETIRKKSSKITTESIKNLKSMIDTMEGSDVNSEVDARTMKAAKESKEIKDLQIENEQLKKAIITKDNELNELRDEVQDLKVHVNELWVHLHLKRFVYADKLYNVLNRALPLGSSRRRLFASPYKLARYIKQTPVRAEAKKQAAIETQARNNLISIAEKHKSVVVYISMPWDNIMRQRPHHLAEKLSDLGHMIVYMDYEATVTKQINENLFIVPGDWCIDRLAKIEGLKRFFLLPAGYSLPYDKVAKIVDSGYSLIYEYIDELDETISGDLDNQKEVLSKLEQLKPALVVASAKKLYDEMSSRFGSSQKVIMNANAVDMSHFNLNYKWANEDAPEDLKPVIATGKPIVGYYGALAPWLDYDLLNALTEKRQDLSFVFIGVNYNDGLKNLIPRKNVFILGAKNYLDLPSYSYWFNCAMIPFQKGEIAKATSPVKLFEYMAMGLPTICTFDLKECYGYEYVYISKDTDDFESNINKAIVAKEKKHTQKILQKQAMDNTWQARAATISEALNNFIDREEVK